MNQSPIWHLSAMNSTSLCDESRLRARRRYRRTFGQKQTATRYTSEMPDNIVKAMNQNHKKTKIFSFTMLSGNTLDGWKERRKLTNLLLCVANRNFSEGRRMLSWESCNLFRLFSDPHLTIFFIKKRRTSSGLPFSNFLKNHFSDTYHRPSNFCTLPDGPYLWNVHLVTLGNTRDMGSPRSSGSISVKLSTSLPYVENSPPKK